MTPLETVCSDHGIDLSTIERLMGRDLKGASGCIAVHRIIGEKPQPFSVEIKSGGYETIDHTQYASLPPIWNGVKPQEQER